MPNTIQFLRTDLASLWQGEDIFAVVQRLKGEIFRHKEGRQTLRFILADKFFFVKRHQGIGWLEIIKSILQWRIPVISAKNEWQAIQFLQSYGIDTLTIAGYGERGINPAKKQSFLITDEMIDTMSLEYLGRQWRQYPPSYASKKLLIDKLAVIAKVMHENGMNHRDFYLCHFLLDKSFAEHNTIKSDTRLFLIDLHRAQIRQKTPTRWIIKDLGGLLFSALGVPLTQRDLWRFMMVYSGLPLRELLTKHSQFWINVQKRANNMQK